MASRSTASPLVLLLVCALTPGLARGSGEPAARPSAPPARAPSELAPLPAAEKPPYAHAPFESGDCSTCHQKDDPKAPGPLKGKGNEVCYGCHEELQTMMGWAHQHAPAADACTTCHNPHNARVKKLLLAEQPALCFGCHADIEALATKSKVRHAALTTGARCANCHNPHASNVEKLLIDLPFDLCVKCHSQDGIPDGRGGTLTNFKRWLDQNKVWHAPVEAKDCSACHRTHGSDHFRLLQEEYPAAFYAPFDAKNYALCFSCHNSQVVSVAETTTLTGFRDGSRNLHYLHVTGDRGRTCRACHEVHASKQEHHIREGVPYGKTGWVLKLNYVRTASGGSCAKTCHATKTYDRGAKPASQR